MMKKCFLLGHRNATEALLPELIRVMISHVTEEHVQEFVVGKYGDFDSLAARAALEVKKQYPHVRLVQLHPYLKGTIPEGFDGGRYPEGMETVPLRLAIVRANRAAIDQADCIIAYVWHTASNTRKMLEYAQKRKLPIALISRDGRTSRRL